MKKSNILLISTVFIAFFWTVLIGWFAASAINNYLHGKDPYLARTHRQYLESKKKIFPLPVSELVISGEGTAILTILPGKKLTVLSAPRIWNCVYTDLKNGKSMITFKKIKDLFDDPVIITLPEVPSLSLDNFSEVIVNGLNQKEIHLKCNHVKAFHTDSCKIGTLSLDFPGKKDQQDIHINKSNQIDNFIASVKGFGNFRLETAGQIKNQISLSDSIHVEATYYVMKKLAIGPESRKTNVK